MKDLKEWYENLGEYHVEPHGLMKIKVPVLEPSDKEEPEQEQSPACEVPSPEKEGNERIKEKELINIKNGIICTRGLENLLMRLSMVNSPFDKDSFERNEILTKLREKHAELGEELGKL